MSSAPESGRLSGALKEDLEWELIRFRLDKMLDSGLARMDREPPEPVSELHLELTHRCNLKCVMCEHWEMEFLDPGTVAREMSFADIQAVVEKSALLKTVTNVVITGGEPWLRHDFVDIVAWLSRRFPDAKIVALTNFWNTGHMRLKLTELRARGVRNLSLGSSLDGLGATHDRIRGQQGAFDGLARTAAALRAEFPEMPFGFTFTLLPDNATELFATYEFVTRELTSSLGCQWAVQTAGVAPIVWSEEKKSDALAQIRLIQLDLCRKNEAASKLHELLNPGLAWLWAELLYWRWLEEYGREPRRFAFFKRCTAGERHVMIGAEGELFFCPVNRAMTIGHAVKDGVDAAWTSKKADEVRDFVASCRCHCWLRCVSAPAVERLLRLARTPAQTAT